MNLTQLLSNHREAFRQKFIEALAKKNSLPPEKTAVEFKDFIEQFVDEKYKHLKQLVNRINEIEKPLLLNIR
ncbi:MAG: hypothetical protein Q8N79_01905, partial [Candidatus Methanoperedens sp.]|nr:hypothetical protein [Candidatus Methanoperedens sp.]